jgi:hypothetical protein
MPVGVAETGLKVGFWIGPLVDTGLVVVGVALGPAVGETETGVFVGASVFVVGFFVTGANVAPPTYVLQVKVVVLPLSAVS